MASDLGKTLQEIDAMPSTEFVQWMAYYKVRYEQQTDTEPPLEFDNDSEADAALDDLLGF